MESAVGSALGGSTREYRAMPSSRLAPTAEAERTEIASGEKPGKHSHLLLLISPSPSLPQLQQQLPVRSRSRMRQVHQQHRRSSASILPSPAPLVSLWLLPLLHLPLQLHLQLPVWADARNELGQLPLSSRHLFPLIPSPHSATCLGHFMNFDMLLPTAGRSMDMPGSCRLTRPSGWQQQFSQLCSSNG